MQFRILMAAMAAALVLGSSAVRAQELNGDDLFSPAEPTGNIRAMQKIPDTSMKAVETAEDGMTTFISPNGRYVIKGTLYDVWQGKSVRSVAELMETGNHINFAKMKIDLDDLGAFTYGRGPKQAVIFVDPKCPICSVVMRQMPALADKYTFKLMVLPLLGAESGRLTRMLSCATDPGAALQALMTDRMGTTLPQLEKCSLLGIQKRLVTAQLIGVRGVPFMVAPDGRAKPGAVQDLEAWLEGRS